LNKSPDFCPMKLMPEVIDKAGSEYDKPDVVNSLAGHLCRNSNAMNKRRKEEELKIRGFLS
jgi:hypothetical protein